jgi:hypothetical protein
MNYWIDAWWSVKARKFFAAIIDLDTGTVLYVAPQGKDELLAARADAATWAREHAIPLER